MLESYEIAWRPNYEKYQAAIWCGFGALSASLPIVFNFPERPSNYFAIACISMGVMRAYPAIRNATRLKHLQKVLIDFFDRKKLAKKTAKKQKENSLWLGWGFEWDTSHAQLAFDLIKRDPSKFLNDESRANPGAAWLHGLAQKEDEVDIPLSMLDGQTLIVGTTGAGKTRLLDMIVTQAIARGEPTLVLDPKGDKELWQGMKKTCEAIGHPERFMYFHPGFPEDSIRFNPLHNFTRATEVASRIAMLIPSETGSDPFKSFSQMALTNIIAGSIAVGQRPSLVRIRSYLEGGVDRLLARVLERYFEENMEGWRSATQSYVTRARGSKVDGYLAYYADTVDESSSSSEVEGLISMYQHDRVHMSKMLTSLMPVLNTLTAGDLGKILSPRPDDMDDHRLITDSATMVRQGQAVYIGLDSLTDTIVGSAIGSIMLSDLTAVAGARYNYGDGMERPVNIIVDELAEVINDPMISLLARGRGAKVRVIAATQTVADLSARLGSEDKARQVIANCNNLIALRTPEPETQKYICEGLPMTAVKHIMQTQGTNTDAEVPLVYGSNYGERLMETEKELFSPEYLGLLPNFHYLARLTGGRLVKGRIPIISDQEGAN